MRQSTGESAGQVEGFDAFYRESYASVVRLAVLLVDDVGTAEDISQEAFLRTQQRWGDSGLDNPAGFVRRCVVNAGRDVQRRRAVRRKAVLDVPAATNPAYREMDDVLVRLPYQERVAVVCRYYLDLPEGEIAELLEIAPSTVRTVIRRAIAALRKEIEP